MCKKGDQSHKYARLIMVICYSYRKVCFVQSSGFEYMPTLSIFEEKH